MVPPSNLLFRIFSLSSLAFMAQGKQLNYKFPYGPYTARPDQEVSLREAQELCDLDLSCAGITSLPDPKKNGTNRILAHSFLPIVMNETYKSPKHFTFHAGKVKDSNILEVRHGDMSVGEAKDYCHDRLNCVAFFHPVYNPTLELSNPDNITFVSSIESFEPDSRDEWRTFVANDLSRANSVNHSSLSYSEIVSVEHPFKSCCTKTEIPTIEQIQAVDTLERISCDISRKDFFENYEKRRKPVMLVGCNKDWKAQDRWSYEKLIPRFDNSSTWRATIGNNEKLKEDVAWSDIASSMVQNSPFYIFDQLDHKEGKKLEEDYEWPGPIQGGDLYGSLNDFPEDYGSKRWFCVGTGGTGTDPHMDPLGTDAWNTVIKGHKWWIVYPERVTDEEDLECDDECSVPIPSARHWYASVGINAARSEYDNGDRPFHILQKPGETIYLPYGRVHSVFNMDDTIAITANYGSEGNFDEVWKTVVTDGEKRHWRKLYYQVFNKEQRRRARESEYWHPDEYVDDEEDENVVNEEDIHSILHNLKKRLSGDDVNAKRESFMTLSKLINSDGDDNDNILRAVFNSRLAESIIDGLEDPSYVMVLRSLRVIGHIVSGSNENAQAMIDAGLMPKMQALLSQDSNEPTLQLVKKEACYVLTNIAGGTDEQTNELLKKGILNRVIELAYSSNRGLREEAIWVIANVVSSLDEHVISAVESGALEALYNFLSDGDAKNVAFVLQSIENILEVGTETGKTYAQKVVNMDGLEALERLASSQNMTVQQRANEVLKRFFTK
mmetsp:Transcript_14596/g.30708  ORF Transcript_14596/g.30708 Transcript_14596/m.30708 type:complete len:780 (+) Transcript_14596:290-2629(+)|eukprot:CAMPEP_0171343500 /NCGR_PEP_ID=MMETSP0878-20121228/17311_1 /TAXON_ID=67004 /ORGANISM="Thalassiosira weissflogii, Strain CCMP1336" /LENGTH=779 /DNA_ID=CAMNT_0011846459 /DNA_START=273 /DNA_END=2612 /DNA_ORIENTATION=-